jgi:alpha-galactosidase
VQLVPLAIDVVLSEGGASHTLTTPWSGDNGAFGLGPVEVDVEVGPNRTRWSVANQATGAVNIRSVALVYRLMDSTPPIRMFRNGYQSWSPTGTAVLGLDVDPSTLGGHELLRAAHHADQRPARAGELRSEWTTVLADDAPGGSPLLVGFMGGDHHDGTFRLVPSTDPRQPAPELRAEAFLGDATLNSGSVRILHDVVHNGGGPGASELLEVWAADIGHEAGARTQADYQVGWCSWYQYFHQVTEHDLLANLTEADRWPFDVFQIDDGYQAAIGDWLDTSDQFPSDLSALASAIRGAGRTPGLWLAPFLVAPDAEVARRHPDWLARRTVDDVDRGPLRTWWNPAWGGGLDGYMYGLDTTHPDVLSHLEHVAAAVVDAGFPYLKLDFTFSPSVDGGYADPGQTPAERVRSGFDALRRGAGSDAFLLGCGVPLAHVVGVVDANRIGPDVAPVWALRPDDEIVPGYLGTQPATAHALTNTLSRSWMHRNLWLNDPDCLMLRSSDTALGPESARTWARAVAVSGGMALVSDDLSLLDGEARSLLDEVIAVGRASDNEARQGRPARCPDLLDESSPSRLDSVSGSTLEADPTTGATREWSTRDPT